MALNGINIRFLCHVFLVQLTFWPKKVAVNYLYVSQPMGWLKILARCKNVIELSFPSGLLLYEKTTCIMTTTTTNILEHTCCCFPSSLFSVMLIWLFHFFLLSVSFFHPLRMKFAMPVLPSDVNVHPFLLHFLFVFVLPHPISFGIFLH